MIMAGVYRKAAAAALFGGAVLLNAVSFSCVNSEIRNGHKTPEECRSIVESMPSDDESGLFEKAVLYSCKPGAYLALRINE